MISTSFPENSSFYFYIERYIWVLNLLLLVLVGLTAAHVTSNAVRAHFARPAQVEPWKPPVISDASQADLHFTSVDLIEKRNLFKAKIVEEAPKSESAEAAIAPLDIVVKGIIIGPGWAFATIKDNKANKNKVLAIGDELEPGTQIVSMDATTVIFQRSNGSEEEFSLSFGPKGKEPQRKTPAGSASAEPPGGPDYGKDIRAISETEYVIDRQGFQAALENLNELITQARLTPAMGPDRKMEGFRVFSVRQGSIFQKLGIRNGDVIQRVNGVVMDDAKKGFEMFQTLKDQSHFTIDLRRGSEKKTYTYDVR